MYFTRKREKRKMKIKTIAKILLCAALIALVCASACSCGGKKETDITNNRLTVSDLPKDENGLPVIHTTDVSNAIGDFTVVRSDTAKENVKELASRVRTVLSDYTGKNLKISTDAMSSEKMEILIGETTREESKNALSMLGINDYIIKLDGLKIVIAGGSDEALENAVNDFTENFLFDGKVAVPNKKGLLYAQTYAFENIKIEGKDISEYKIYSTNAKCAQRLSDNIFYNFCGKRVEVAENMPADGTGYIVLDAKSLDYCPYKAELKDGNLYVSGSFKSCFEFFDYFVKSGEKNPDVKKSFEGEIDKPNLYTKEELMTVLKDVYDSDKVILGEQANTMKVPSTVFDSFEKSNGKYPGIAGFDLGCYGLRLYAPEGEENNKMTDEQLSEAFCEIVEYAENGGIVTISSHFANPSRQYGDDAWVRGDFGGEAAWKKLFTEGDEYNTRFNDELDADIAFLKLCRDIGLPIIWRPLHEINSNWFWYSIANGGTLPAEYGVNLWKYIYDRFGEAGLDNLVWCYSPNVNNGWIDAMYCYPGDGYVDIVSCDWYSGGAYEIGGSGKTYEKLMGTDKITNLGEFGITGDICADNKKMQELTWTCADFTALVKQMMSDGYKIGYILTWTSQNSTSWWGQNEKMWASGIFLDRDALGAKFAEIRSEGK